MYDINEGNGILSNKYSFYIYDRWPVWAPIPSSLSIKFLTPLRSDLGARVIL